MKAQAGEFCRIVQEVSRVGQTTGPTDYLKHWLYLGHLINGSGLFAADKELRHAMTDYRNCVKKAADSVIASLQGRQQDTFTFERKN